MGDPSQWVIKPSKVDRMLVYFSVCRRSQEQGYDVSGDGLWGLGMVVGLFFV